MNKADIDKLRIDLKSGPDSALSLMLGRNGMIARQGNGKLPADTTSVLGESDGSSFNALIDALDERVFPHAGIYDHPHKPGLPIIWSIAFLDRQGNTAVFEFRFGSDTADVGELLPYFDGFISQAVALTDKWYAAEKLNPASAA